MADFNQYENFAMTMRHSILVNPLAFISPFSFNSVFYTWETFSNIQYVHCHEAKAELVKKDLTKKTQEAIGLLSSLNKAKANNRGLMDKATTAQSTQPKVEAAAREVEEKAKAAEAKYAKAEVKAKIAENKSKLAETLEAKEAEIKAADDKASAKGQADVRDQYKKQVNLAYNKGYFLGWMATLKKLFVLEDSPL